MNWKSFYKLTSFLLPDPIFKNSSSNSEKLVEIQLATAFYFIGSLEAWVIRGTAQLGIGEGTIHLYCDRCTITLVWLIPQFVTWSMPARGTVQTMQISVEESSKFPGYIEYLDGTDIVLQWGPGYHGEPYVNHKKQYVINIQDLGNSQQGSLILLEGIQHRLAMLQSSVEPHLSENEKFSFYDRINISWLIRPTKLQAAVWLHTRNL